MTKTVAATAMFGLWAAFLMGGILHSGALAQSAASAGKNSAQAAKSASAGRSRYWPSQSPKRAAIYYGMLWGVDDLRVRSVESGEIIKFTYRIVDAKKAKPLNDKRSEPILIDEKAGVKLVVPSLEKVGQLRQSGTPEEGKVYWMAFSNKGNLVRRGSRVNVVIGNFRAEGLEVE